MTYNVELYYEKSINTDDVKLKYIKLGNLCYRVRKSQSISSGEIQNCNIINLDYYFSLNHVVESPYSQERTLIEFVKKVISIKEKLGDTKLLSILE